MTSAKRARPASKPAKAGPPRSPESIAHAAVRREGQLVPGGKVRLTLGITLSRAQADRLALVAEILEVVPTEPTA